MKKNIRKVKVGDLVVFKEDHWFRRHASSYTKKEKEWNVGMVDKTYYRPKTWTRMSSHVTIGKDYVTKYAGKAMTVTAVHETYFDVNKHRQPMSPWMVHKVGEDPSRKKIYQKLQAISRAQSIRKLRRSIPSDFLKELERDAAKICSV